MIKFFGNLNLKSKFVFVLAIIFILMFVLGVSGIKSLMSTSNNYYKVTVLNNKVIQEINIAQINISDMRRIVTRMVYDKNSEKSLIEEFTQINKIASIAITKSIEELKYMSKVGLNKTEEIKLMQGVQEEIIRYNGLNIRLLSALEESNIELQMVIFDEMFPLGKEIVDTFYEVTTQIFEQIELNTSIIRDMAIERVIRLVILFIVILIMGCSVGMCLSVSIRRPIEKLKNIAVNVAKGRLEQSPRSESDDEIGELSNAIADMSDIFNNILMDINNLSSELDKGNMYYRIDVSKYEGKFADATEGINVAMGDLVNDTLYIIEKIKEFGNGYFDAEIKEFAGEKAIIKEDIISVQTSFKNVYSDINRLIQSAIEGNLEFTLDTGKYVGQWKETTEGLNTFIENVVNPIKETQNALNKFSEGDFSYRITNEYKGEFNNIKQTVNYTAETIDSYISEISHTLSEISNKNFDLTIDRNYVGGFKQIQESVNLIIENFNVLTKEIIKSAEQVSLGAKQISAFSTSIEQGATEQGVSVDKLTKIIEGISNQSGENAENSSRANNLALEAKNSANQGSKHMDGMLVAMNDINSASNEISNIIKVIDDIAFQTNILALNAAVEAARAGEHGKGFAVVAEEVRTLAVRSQQAAKETTELIERSVNKVEEGSKIANNTAIALHSIVKQIEEISKLANACASSSKEQEKEIDDITSGIKEISEVTHVNTSNSEDSSVASKELAKQAEIFYNVVSRFKLRDKY